MACRRAPRLGSSIAPVGDGDAVTHGTGLPDVALHKTGLGLIPPSRQSRLRGSGAQIPVAAGGTFAGSEAGYFGSGKYGSVSSGSGTLKTSRIIDTPV